MSKYYTHIEDCTVYAWTKAIDGDLTHLRLDGGSELEDSEAWDKVYDSYIVEIGLGKDYNNLLELKTELAETQLDYVIENNRMIINRINALEVEILEILNRKSEGGDMTSTLIMISKWLGYKVDQRNTTVKELYKMLDLIKAQEK